MKLKAILEYNEKYRKRQEEVKNLYKELKGINDQIDLDEVKQLTYQEVKLLRETIKYSINDEEKLKAIEEILKNKKIEEYPAILGVHYYPEINEIDLDDNEKTKLDRLVKESTYNMNRLNDLRRLDTKIHEFLIEKNIIEREYAINCGCNGGFGCDRRILSQKEYSEYKAYWDKKEKGETTDEEDDKFSYGSIYVSCSNDRDVEVRNNEEFIQSSIMKYKIVKEPDMTLDEI